MVVMIFLMYNCASLDDNTFLSTWHQFHYLKYKKTLSLKIVSISWVKILDAKKLLRKVSEYLSAPTQSPSCAKSCKIFNIANHLLFWGLCRLQKFVANNVFRSMWNIFNHLLACLCCADLLFLIANLLIHPVHFGIENSFTRFILDFWLEFSFC